MIVGVARDAERGDDLQGATAVIGQKTERIIVDYGTMLDVDEQRACLTHIGTATQYRRMPYRISPIHAQGVLMMHRTTVLPTGDAAGQ